MSWVGRGVLPWSETFAGFFASPTALNSLCACYAAGSGGAAIAEQTLDRKEDRVVHELRMDRQAPTERDPPESPLRSASGDAESRLGPMVRARLIDRFARAGTLDAGTHDALDSLLAKPGFEVLRQLVDLVDRIDHLVADAERKRRRRTLEGLCESFESSAEASRLTEVFLDLAHRHGDAVWHGDESCHTGVAPASAADRRLVGSTAEGGAHVGGVFPSPWNECRARDRSCRSLRGRFTTAC